MANLRHSIENILFKFSYMYYSSQSHNNCQLGAHFCSSWEYLAIVVVVVVAEALYALLGGRVQSGLCFGKSWNVCGYGGDTRELNVSFCVLISLHFVLSHSHSAVFRFIFLLIVFPSWVCKTLFSTVIPLSVSSYSHFPS